MSNLIVTTEEALRQLVAGELRAAVEEFGLAGPPLPRPETPHGATTVRGLDPHALYSRKTLAERWDSSTETVRRIPAAELPEASWGGGQVRYRGADVLRYEGVSESEIWQGTREPVSMASGRPPRTGRPPKAGALPKL